MDTIRELIKRAKKSKGTIIVPEASLDKRVYNACSQILKHKISRLVVFGTPKQFGEEFKNDDCLIINPERNKYLLEFAKQLYDLRKDKGLTKNKAEEMVKNYNYFACMMLYNNLADGMVAGAKWTTADTLRPALQTIKTKEGKDKVVGGMLLVKSNKKPLFYADVSLNESPDQKLLSEIAVSSGEFVKNVLGKTPKIAMLSYSTHGSADSDKVKLIQNATALVKKTSNFLVDGEMQFDTAVDKTTALQKGITSNVGGNANTFIFPDLNAGNIAYKITARLAGYTAVGPIMLNFKKPVNDLSRGSSIAEIINTICITKLQIED